MSWPLGKVSDIANVISGYAFKTEWFGTGSDKIIRIGNLQNGRVSDNGAVTFDSGTYKISEQFKIQSGDILMALSGATVGKIALAQEKDSGLYLNQRVAIVRGKSRENADYLKYVFSGQLLKKLLLLAGGAAQPNLSPKSLADMEIPIPTLVEQKRIAAILDKADSLRRKNQQAIQLADQFLRAVFLDMFGDPVTNPKGWESGELNNYLDFLTSGSRGWAKYYSNSGDKFIRIQNISNNKLLLDDLAYVNAPDGAEARRTKIQSGDVLLSITADLGRSAVVTEEITDGYINQHLALLRINQNILNSRYLAAYLSSEAGVKQFQAKNKSAVKAGLNFTDIRSLNILMPPIEQQKKYEQMYKKVVSLISSKQKSMQISETLFNSLSQKAFAGEL